MRDAVTQKALERIADGSFWITGWLVCILVSSSVFINIAHRWNAFNSSGKIEALTFALILFPAKVVLTRKR